MKKKTSAAAQPREADSASSEHGAEAGLNAPVPTGPQSAVGFRSWRNPRELAAYESAIKESPGLLKASGGLLDLAARHHQRGRHFRSFGRYLFLETGEEGRMVNLKLNDLLKPFLRNVAQWDGSYFLNDASPAGRRMYDYRFTWIEKSGYSQEIPASYFERFPPLVMLCPTVEAKPVVEALFRANPSDPLQALDDLLEVLEEAVEHGECPPFGDTLGYLLGIIGKYCRKE